MIPLIPIALVSAGVLGVSVVGLANLNVVNLLLNETEYIAPAETPIEKPGESFDLEGEGDVKTSSGKSGTDTIMQSVQSGLPMAGGKLDLLWLLQNAKDPDVNSYAYNLLEVYAKNENGKYNNNPYHISSDALAGSHFNETKLKTFLVPSVKGFGKPTGGKFGQVVNGKKLNLENTMSGDVDAGVGGDSVYVDNGGDGKPDGPFQIEKMPTGDNANKYANKERSGGTFDYVNFIDNINFVDSKYSAILNSANEAGLNLDPRVISALFGMYHNRGPAGVAGMIHGRPFSITHNMQWGTYLHNTTLESMTGDRLKKATNFTNQFIKWFDASNIPLELVVSQGSVNASRALANVITMKNGGFIATELSSQTKKGIKEIPKEVLNKIYPGMTHDQVIAHINSNNVKKPWTALGMTKGEFDKIYGAHLISSQYEEVYRINNNWYNTIFWFDDNIRTDNYKNGTGNDVVLSAIEGIAAGYMIDTGVTGTFVLLQIALEAGIKSLTNGAIIDPSNPDNMYKSVENGSYSPVSGLTGNFETIMDLLGLTGKLKPATQTQLSTIYEVSGGVYGQLKSLGYEHNRGDMVNGFMVTDCSSMTAMGFRMTTSKSVFTSTAAVKDGLWFKRGVYNEVNGEKYEAYVYQVDNTGKAYNTGTTNLGGKWDMKDYQWLDVARPGDIINGRKGGAGHIFTYVTTNRTGKTIVIPPEISKTAPGNSTYKNGEHIVLESGGPTFLYKPRKTGLHMRNSTHGADRSGKAYQMYRPAYNMEPSELNE